MLLNRYEMSDKKIKVCDLPTMNWELGISCSATVPPSGEHMPLWDQCALNVVSPNLEVSWQDDYRVIFFFKPGPYLPMFFLIP